MPYCPLAKWFTNQIQAIHIYIYTQQFDQPCTKVGSSFINDSIILVGYNTTNVYSRKAARLRCPKQNTLYRDTFKKININMQIVMSAICISYIHMYIIYIHIYIYTYIYDIKRTFSSLFLKQCYLKRKQHIHNASVNGFATRKKLRLKSRGLISSSGRFQAWLKWKNDSWIGSNVYKLCINRSQSSCSIVSSIYYMILYIIKL